MESQLVLLADADMSELDYDLEGPEILNMDEVIQNPPTESGDDRPLLTVGDHAEQKDHDVAAIDDDDDDNKDIPKIKLFKMKSKDAV